MNKSQRTMRKFLITLSVLWTTLRLSAANCDEILNPLSGLSTCSSSKTPVGETCTITCNNGFALTAGVTLTTCQSGNNWDDNQAHECSAINCPAIPKPTNGDSTCSGEEKPHASSCKITCTPGYTLTGGIATVTCGDGDANSAVGRWSSTDTHVCSALCTKIDSPQHGTSTCATGTLVAGTSCAITCDSGYSLTSGSSLVTCKDDGTWSDQHPPTCAVTACPRIDPTPNGISSCSETTSPSGTICRLSCTEGYSQTGGQSTVVCQDSTNDSGKWNDTASATCTATTCQPIPPPQKGSSSCSSGTFSNGTNCTVVCNNGKNSKYAVCNDAIGMAGMWSNNTEVKCASCMSTRNLMMMVIFGIIAFIVM